MFELPERWRTRPRLVVLFVVTAVLVLTLLHYNYSPGDGYFTTYHNHYDAPPDLAHVGSNNMESLEVECHWAEVELEDTRKLTEKAAPEFSLLSAWLKPEAARYGPALLEIPPALKDEYLQNGRILYERYFFDEAYLGAKALHAVWNVKMIKELRKRVRGRDQWLKYDTTPIYEALDRWAVTAVKGKRGLVIGTESPWLEAMLLEYGASHVTTLEFGAIKTSHPQLSTYVPQEFTVDFLEGKIPQYDFAFSYSSLEHDGLGRYGDVLNPRGDLHSMARLLNIVKPGGFMFLGVPCCEDALYWNAHRVYGPLRYSDMFAGWRVLGSAPSNALGGKRGGHGDWLFQPVWALQNRMGCKA